MSTAKATALVGLIEATGRGGVFDTTSAGNVGGTTIVSTNWQSAALLPTDHLDGVWMNVPSITAPRQARVTPTGLTIGSGTIALDVALGAQVGSGVTVRWSPLLPIVSAASVSGPSFEDCLYETLRHLLAPDEVSVAVATTPEIPLSTWASWLNRSDRLVGVLEPSPVSGYAALDTGYRPRLVTSRWGDMRYGEDNVRDIRLVLDGEAPMLRLTVPYAAASGNLTLQVLRPADTWFKTSGTWTETAPGTALAAETDECLPDMRHLREAGLVFVYRALAASREGPRRAEYQAKYEAQLALARQLPYWDHSRDDLEPRPPSAASQQQEAA